MPRKQFPKACQKTWEAEFDWVADSWRLALMTSAWAYDVNAEFFDDLTGVVATALIPGRSNSLGLLGGSNVVFTGLTPGSVITQMVIYKDTGVAATSPLGWHIPTGNGIPFTTDSSETEIDWQDGIVATQEDS